MEWSEQNPISDEDLAEAAALAGGMHDGYAGPKDMYAHPTQNGIPRGQANRGAPNGASMQQAQGRQQPQNMSNGARRATAPIRTASQSRGPVASRASSQSSRGNVSNTGRMPPQGQAAAQARGAVQSRPNPQARSNPQAIPSSQSRQPQPRQPQSRQPRQPSQARGNVSVRTSAQGRAPMQAHPGAQGQRLSQVQRMPSGQANMHPSHAVARGSGGTPRGLPQQQRAMRGLGRVQGRASQRAGKGPGSFAGITLFTKILKRNTPQNLHASIEQAVRSFILKYQKLTTQSNQEELLAARSNCSMDLLTTFQAICGEDSIKQAVSEFRVLNENAPRLRQGAAMGRYPPGSQRGSSGASRDQYDAAVRMRYQQQRRIAGQYSRLIKAWNHACACEEPNCGNEICAKIKPSVLHQQELKLKGLVGQCGPDCEDCSLYKKLCNFSSAQGDLSARVEANRRMQQRSMMRSQHSAGSHMNQLQQAEQQAYGQSYGQEQYREPNRNFQGYQGGGRVKPEGYQRGVKSEGGQYRYNTKDNGAYGGSNSLPMTGPPPDDDMMDVANLLDDEEQLQMQRSLGHSHNLSAQGRSMRPGQSPQGRQRVPGQQPAQGRQPSQGRQGSPVRQPSQGRQPSHGRQPAQSRQTAQSRQASQSGAGQSRQSPPARQPSQSRAGRGSGQGRSAAVGRGTGVAAPSSMETVTGARASGRGRGSGGGRGASAGRAASQGRGAAQRKSSGATRAASTGGRAAGRTASGRSSAGRGTGKARTPSKGKSKAQSPTAKETKAKRPAKRKSSGKSASQGARSSPAKPKARKTTKKQKSAPTATSAQTAKAQPSDSFADPLDPGAEPDDFLNIFGDEPLVKGQDALAGFDTGNMDFDIVHNKLSNNNHVATSDDFAELSF